MSDARRAILGRVRQALAGREPVSHPGDFAGPRPSGALDPDPLQAFQDLLTRAGGEVVPLPSETEAVRWLAGFSHDFASVSVGTGVPDALAPDRPRADPAQAELAVSRARCAVAETGSVVMDARDGRRTQLLPPTHLVWLRRDEVHATLREALRSMADDLPSALGLHSGPSKSADIGQIVVRGVHGPGRIVVGLLPAEERRPSLPDPTP